MYKVTVLYNYPKNPDEFEKYYHDVHLPIARQMPHLSKLELTKFEVGPGDTQPAYHRMAEIFYSSKEVMEESMGTPESQAAIDDLQNFATGGVTIMLGAVSEG